MHFQDLIFQQDNDLVYKPKFTGMHFSPWKGVEGTRKVGL